MKNVSYTRRLFEVDVNYVLFPNTNTSREDIEEIIEYCKRERISSLRFIEYMSTESYEAASGGKDYFSYHLKSDICSDNEIKIRKRQLGKIGEMGIEYIKCSCALSCDQCREDRDLYILTSGYLEACIFDNTRISVHDSENAIEKYLNYRRGTL